MALKTLKNGRKAFDFASKDNAQMVVMLKEAIAMVKASASGRRSGFRMGLLDEVSAECERRGINCAAVACAG